MCLTPFQKAIVAATTAFKAAAKDNCTTNVHELTDALRKAQTYLDAGASNFLPSEELKIIEDFMARAGKIEARRETSWQIVASPSAKPERVAPPL